MMCQQLLTILVLAATRWHASRIESPSDWARTMHTIIFQAQTFIPQHGVSAGSPVNHLHLTGGLLTCIIFTVIGFFALPSTPALIRELVQVARSIVLYRMLDRRKDLSAKEYTTLAKLILRK
jgi:hypothetical protein